MLYLSIENMLFVYNWNDCVYMTCQIKLKWYTSHTTCCKPTFFLAVLRLAFIPKMPGRVDGGSLSLTSHIWDREWTEALVLERRFKDSYRSLCSPASSHLAVLWALHHQSKCQFEGRMRRLTDILLAVRRGNFLCVCVSKCVCMGVRGCLKECWWASQSVCLHSFLSGRDVRRANEKHMRPPVLCQLVMYPHARANAHGHTHTHTLMHTHNSCYCSKSPLCPLSLFHVSSVAGLD